MVSGIACDAMKTLRTENEIGLEARVLEKYLEKQTKKSLTRKSMICEGNSMICEGNSMLLRKCYQFNVARAKSG